jgi:hypothetical protein
VKTALQPSYFGILKAGTVKGTVSTNPVSMQRSAKAWLMDEKMFAYLKE